VNSQYIGNRQKETANTGFWVKALVQQPDAEIHRGTAGDTRRHLVLHKLLGFFPQENKFDQRCNQLPQGLFIDDSRFTKDKAVD
jgi:hypothetical protein